MRGPVDQINSTQRHQPEWQSSTILSLAQGAQKKKKEYIQFSRQLTSSSTLHPFIFVHPLCVVFKQRVGLTRKNKENVFVMDKMKSVAGTNFII
jgi:hypothetical protein